MGNQGQGWSPARYDIICSRWFLYFDDVGSFYFKKKKTGCGTSLQNIRLSCSPDLVYLNGTCFLYFAYHLQTKIHLARTDNSVGRNSTILYCDLHKKEVKSIFLIRALQIFPQNLHPGK